MIMFGLGTLPMLLGITLAGNLMGLAFRKRINKVIPVLVILVGIFFVLRGLSLGIPYLSPPKEKIEKKFEKSLEKETGMETGDTGGSPCCTTLFLGESW
jgi:sulfite exporter TauE/SafE